MDSPAVDAPAVVPPGGDNARRRRLPGFRGSGAGSWSARMSDRIASLPLRTRMLVAMIALLAAVCLVVGSISLLLLRGFLISQLDIQLDSAGRRFLQSYTHRPSCDSSDHDGAPCFLLSPGQRFGTLGARIVDGEVRQGGVLDKDATPHGIGPGEDADVLNVPNDGRPHTRDIGRLGDYRLLAVQRSDDTVFVTGLPLDEVNTTLVRLGWIELVVAACGLVVAGAASTLIVRHTMRPLRRVAATAGRVAELRLDRGEVALAERVAPSDTDPRTEVGQVGAALNRMLEHVAGALEARQASETQLRQFLADASHELRTPLAAIRGYAELTRRSTDHVPPDVAHALRRVSSQAERMTSLVEDMLLLARLDAGRPLGRDQVDVSQLVVDAVSDAHAAGPDHRWTLDLPDEAVTVTGDATRLSQVLANLLTNARVHTPPGTTVRAELSGGAAGALLHVVDDGPGIPEALLPHVFGRFARGDSSRSRAAGSTGLGLAIAYAVVTAHGGQVGVRSAPGRTVFTVWLPADGAPAIVPSVEAAAGNGLGANGAGANGAGANGAGANGAGANGAGANGAGTNEAGTNEDRTSPVGPNGGVGSSGPGAKSEPDGVIGST